MSIVRELAMKLGFDVDKSVGDALLVLHQVNGALDKIRDSAVEFIKSIAEMPEKLGEQAHQLGILSETTGISTDSLQVLGEAARRTGSDITAVARGFRIFATQAYEASKGSAEAEKAFGAVHVSVKDLNGHLKPSEELFNEVAQAVGAVKDPIERMALANKVLGRGSQALVPILMKGKEGLAAIREEMMETGRFIDQEAWEKYHKTMSAVGRQWDGLKYIAAEQLLPALMEMAKASLEFWKQNGPAIRAGVAKTFRILGEALQFVRGVLQLMPTWLWFVVAGVVAVGLGLTALATVAGVASTAMGFLGYASMAAAGKAFVAWLITLGPIALVILALGVLLAVAQDAWAGFHGGKSVVNDWAQYSIGEIYRVRDAMKSLAEDLWNWGKEVGFNLARDVANASREKSGLAPITTTYQQAMGTGAYSPEATAAARAKAAGIGDPAREKWAGAAPSTQNKVFHTTVSIHTPSTDPKKHGKEAAEAMLDRLTQELAAAK